MVLGRDVYSRTKFDAKLAAPSRLEPVSASDRILDDYDDTGSERSNFVAFLLGGVVIAGGLLAFLYYDSDNMSTRDITTGSIVSLERSAPAPETGLSGLPLQVRPSK